MFLSSVNNELALPNYLQSEKKSSKTLTFMISSKLRTISVSNAFVSKTAIVMLSRERKKFSNSSMIRKSKISLSTLQQVNSTN